MAEQNSNERDLVLTPNQYAFVQDATKGHISVYVGPTKGSLSNTDRPVSYNDGNDKYEKVLLETAVREFYTADEGSYIVLSNPVAVNATAHPPIGVNSPPTLQIGRKVNIRGPISFALWPGQKAKVIEGHRLRSNQYVLVRVYDDEIAKLNLEKALLKPAAEGDTGDGSKSAIASMGIKDGDLTTGKLFIIKGTDVSFFIPPTGLEVVPDANGNFVRDARTLESLTYCVLRNENGKKRFVRGPAVVFPEPTETFVEKNGSEIHHAIELNKDMGVYVKVIADYTGEDGKEYKEGDELFITGEQQRIYYQREEHALITYGDGQERYYGIAIPAGEARYLLDKTTGNVVVAKGPSILLPDPRTQVFVRRVLEDHQCDLWFPDNAEAKAHNANLRAAVRKAPQDASIPGGLTEDAVRKYAAPVERHVVAAMSGIGGDHIKRGGAYVPPRTITLDSKYEGAVTIIVFPGYAVQIFSKTGKRRVVVGPTTTFLEYDESLQALALSTGKPKTTDNLKKTAYLQVSNNQITDIIEAVTADEVTVEVKIAYRMNFEGETNADAAQWFAVDNYVKFVCDRARSRLKHAIKQVGIEQFNSDRVLIIRNTILGASVDGEREGMLLPENNLRVYDLDVLGVKIGDAAISKLLMDVQHGAVRQAMEVAAKERQLEAARRMALVDMQTAELKSTTERKQLALEGELVRLRTELMQVRMSADAANAQLSRAEQERQQLFATAMQAQDLARRQAVAEQDDAEQQADLDRKVEELQAEVEAMTQKAQAFTPQLIAALQAFGDKGLAAQAIQSMAPLAILGGESVADVTRKLLAGTPLVKALEGLSNGSNGSRPAQLPASTD